MPDPLIERSDLQYLKRHLLRNNVVLFLGAGFSMAATNVLGRTLPSSKELARALFEYMGYPGTYDDTPLGILYQAALRKPGGNAPLLSLLQRMLQVVDYPEWYGLISRWFWHRIYTTNVDNLVELIFKDYGGEGGLSTLVAPSEYQERDQFLRAVQYVKLNGSLESFDRGLTFDPKEYGRRAAESDVWYDHFVRDFSTRPTVFIGSELDEPLFWQYIAIRQHRSRHGSERRRQSFLVCPHISAAKRDALREFNVKPVEGTAEQFLQELASEPDIIVSRQQVLHNLDPTLEELLALESAGLPHSEIALAEEFFAVFRPVRAEEPVTGLRSHFLLGSPPAWADIFNHLDADREINRTLRNSIASYLTGDIDDGSLVLLTGAAGSGKTTIAKRVSVMLAGEGFSVYFADSTTRFLPEQLIAYLKPYERRIILVFDDASIDLRRVTELALMCSSLKVRPIIVVSIRSNDLALKRYLFEDLNITEVRVPDLSEPDIKAILATLENNGLLGDLRKLSPDARANVFREKARKQILVAMREATRGLGFDEIIEDEYNKTEPREAKLVYLIAAIPSAYHYFVSRGQLVAAMDLPPSDTLGLIEDSLNGILIPRESNPDQLQIRHPVIAEKIVRDVATRDLLAQAFAIYLRLLAHDLPPIKDRRKSRTFRIYQEVINHANLHEIFLKQVELCRTIYESVKGPLNDDGHYWLQYGSYELEWGDLDFAENYLLQAESLMPTNPWVGTALGYLTMRKAVESISPLAAHELLAKGLERLEHQIETVGRTDPYPYHVLGSQRLAFINRWTPLDRRVKELQELHATVMEGVQRHKLSTHLRQLAEDIKRAELDSLVS